MTNLILFILAFEIKGYIRILLHLTKQRISSSAVSLGKYLINVAMLLALSNGNETSWFPFCVYPVSRGYWYEIMVVA